MDQHEEIWLVQLSNGATRAMTLDELDSAFNDGIINEDTYVRRDGAKKWVRLIDELNASEPVPPPAPVPVFSPTPGPVVGPVVYQQYNSVRPVVSEIDADELDFDSPYAKKSGKGKFVVMGLVAAAAVAVAAFGATKLKAPAVDVNASVVNAVQAPVAVTPPPPVEPVVQKPVLADDVKKALADKDNQFSQKQDAKKKARQNQIVPKRGKTQPPPFSKNGSAYDPLNAKL